MFRAVLLYLIALYLVGYSVRWMMEEAGDQGYLTGHKDGMNVGIRLGRATDVHRES
jgi:hypothetical protein